MPIEAPSKQRFYLGLDLGQKRDYTALVVLERLFVSHWGDQWITAGKNDYGTTCHMVRAIERVRLGTPYPEIVDWIHAIVQRPEFTKRAVLTVDNTGLGAPIVDLLRPGLKCHLVPITITGGSGAYNPVTGCVPRMQLLTNLQIMIQQGKIEVADTCSQAAALQKELRHLHPDGPRRGHHDDITMALALAAFSSTKNH